MYQVLKNEDTSDLKGFKKMVSMMPSRNLILGDNLTCLKTFLKLFIG